MRWCSASLCVVLAFKLRARLDKHQHGSAASNRDLTGGDTCRSARGSRNEHRSPAAPRHQASRNALSFWLRELPFSLVLVLTILGVAYTSFFKATDYWLLGSSRADHRAGLRRRRGWQSAADKAARLRLIMTQALHWLAFLVVMNLLLLPSVQRSLHCWLHRAGGFYVAHARHLHRRCPYPFLANLPARADYGARHSGHGVDRKFGFDCSC